MDDRMEARSLQELTTPHLKYSFGDVFQMRCGDDTAKETT